MIGNLQIADFPVPPSFRDGKWSPEPQGQKTHESERSGEAQNIRVLVVDDETLIAETVVEILNGEGFESTAVSTGASAVEMARTWQPDIVLSDVILPGMNGVQTGIKIRELIPNCKIILFSGQAATVDLLEQARLQGHQFQILAKPISPEQLISVIRASSAGHS
jgi:CheY-like chemotaxis protein